MKLKRILFSIAIVFFFYNNLSAQKSTKEILEVASLQAKNENKAVFVKFEASWCGWCKRMTANMNKEETKKMFEDNYVVVHLIVKESKGKKDLETPGAEDFLTKYKGEKSGLPFWLILNKNLELITDSFDINGQNLGCPASKEEVEEFIKKLKMSSNLNAGELKVIEENFILKK